MRTARAISVGLALALAPAWARAEAPRVSVRLYYSRGKGGEACPAEPAALRVELTRAMGYDPFDQQDAAESLTVVMLGRGSGFAARVERFDAAGVSTWSETWPEKPLRGDCTAFIAPLASYLDGLFLRLPGTPAPPAAAPPSEPAGHAPSPPSRSALPGPPPQATNPPEPPNVPNPTRSAASRVAITAYSLAVISLGFGIAFTVDARDKETSARALAEQLDRATGQNACSAPSGGSTRGCAQLVSAFQSQDTANGYRNTSYAVAGVSAAVGITASVLAVTLPPMVNGSTRPQITVRPSGFAVQGAF
jgi:hypothetical protein